jgi:hypothetical protein
MRGISANQRTTQLIEADYAQMVGKEYKSPSQDPLRLKSLQKELAKIRSDVDKYEQWFPGNHGWREQAFDRCAEKLGVPRTKGGHIIFSEITDEIMLKIVNYTPDEREDRLKQFDWTTFIAMIETAKEYFRLQAEVKKLQQKVYGSKAKTNFGETKGL